MISTVTAVAKSKRRLSISIAMQKLVRHSFTIIQNGHKVHSIWQPTFLYFPNLLLNQGHAHTHTHQKQHVYKWSAELVVLIEKQEFLGIYKKIMLQSSLSTLNTGNSWYHMEETPIFQHLLLFKQLRWRISQINITATSCYEFSWMPIILVQWTFTLTSN